MTSEANCTTYNKGTDVKPGDNYDEAMMMPDVYEGDMQTTDRICGTNKSDLNRSRFGKSVAVHLNFDKYGVFLI